ncbi:DUF4421 family protein [Algibacter mikhailovii]|uniref:DUF4421 family protein n=1 Tax=Algibacter mikhailovii TaxID=425498 RepID=UPI001671D20C|nr:DUF4421 family protein [Algibacter mikhailovii]
MKHLFLLYFLLIPVWAFSQNEETEKDSSPALNAYIKDYNNQLNIRLDVTNEQIKYFMPYEQQKANIKTNLNESYGLVFSYRFLSVRLGVRPKLSQNEINNKGETDRFRLRVKLLFDKWTHRLEYNYTRGFYIDNSNDFDYIIENPDFKIQFPRLTTNILSGSSHYKFNDNYSVKAIESNTEIQLQSAGTFMAGIDYSFYFVEGTDYLKLENDEVLNRDSYSDYSGFSPILNAAYHYTYVFEQYWYINAYANPGLGIDFSTKKQFTNGDAIYSNNTLIYAALRTGISAGYNGKKIYFGGEYKYDINSEKFDNTAITLQPIKNNFHLFFGYRFKAPRQVREPVEYIETKVPVLKTDSK